MNPSGSGARYLSVAAVLIIVGIVTSGPGGVLLVEAMAPQPEWQDAETFVEHYSPLQAMPYAFGFLLVLGFVFFFASLVNGSEDRHRRQVVIGLVLCAIYGSLVSLNYIIQVAFVPSALDQSGVILSFVSMVNPKSLPWSVEMFAYAILGLATLVVAPAFSRGIIQRIIRWLFVLNGVASVGGAVMISLDQSVVLSAPSMVGYYLWNALIAAIMVLVIAEFRFGKRST